jgi:hypothetical protein
MAVELNDGMVGKCNPPIATRFKPGKSGNPGGRTKGRQNLAKIVQKVAEELRPVKEDGQTHNVKTADLVFKRLQLRALSGDLEAKKLLDRQREKYQPEDTGPEISGILIPPTMDLETFLVHAAAQRERMLWDQANRDA